MQCTIYRRGVAAGTLHITDDGLYRVLDARIAPSRTLLRLYLPGFGSVGIFEPRDGALVCLRRISRTRLPELPEYASAWCEGDGQWTREAAGRWQRFTPFGREVAARWRCDGPMDLPDAPERLRAVQLEGVWCLAGVLPINR